jgi:hypothetical protein
MRNPSIYPDYIVAGKTPAQLKEYIDEIFDGVSATRRDRLNAYQDIGLVEGVDYTVNTSILGPTAFLVPKLSKGAAK